MKIFKKVLFFLILPVISIILIFLLKNLNNYSFLQGIIKEINYSENELRPTILLENDEGPYYISFEKDIDLEKLNIKVDDEVYIKIDPAIMESYPMQARGYSIMLIKSAK